MYHISKFRCLQSLIQCSKMPCNYRACRQIQLGCRTETHPNQHLSLEFPKTLQNKHAYKEGVRNCFRNYYLSVFFPAFPTVFHAICNILELEPLISHRLCNMLVEFVRFWAWKLPFQAYLQPAPLIFYGIYIFLFELFM